MESQLLSFIQVIFVRMVDNDLDKHTNWGSVLILILIYGVFLRFGPEKDQMYPGLNTSSAEQVGMLALSSRHVSR
jgi:hypothetical protein